MNRCVAKSLAMALIIFYFALESVASNLSWGLDMCSRSE